jgi:hypothetical protein
MPSRWARRDRPRVEVKSIRPSLRDRDTVEVIFSDGFGSVLASRSYLDSLAEFRQLVFLTLGDVLVLLPARDADYPDWLRYKLATERPTGPSRGGPA